MIFRWAVRYPYVWRKKDDSEPTRPAINEFLRPLLLILSFVVAPVACADRNILTPLKPGMMVALSDKMAGLVDIQLIDTGALGALKIIEIGPDYLVLEDIGGISHRWIPISAIRSVVITRLP